MNMITIVELKKARKFIDKARNTILPIVDREVWRYDSLSKELQALEINKKRKVTAIYLDELDDKLREIQRTLKGLTTDREDLAVIFEAIDNRLDVLTAEFNTL